MNPFDVTMRPATLEDEATLSALTARFADFGLPRWRTADEISVADRPPMMAAIHAGQPDNAVFVAERGGAVVGCLHVHAATDFFGRHHAHISVVSVTAAAEGTGVGHAIVDYAEAWARKRGFSLLTLNVFDGNGRAQRLYEQHGFEPEVVKYVKPLE